MFQGGCQGGPIATTHFSLGIVTANIIKGLLNSIEVQ